jgi:hypothetical protein
MTARSERMKLSLGKCWSLLIFDIIGLAISGYAFLLGYQMLTTLPNANAYIILMGFFVGIKVIVISLYDLNRNLLLKNVPFVGAAISIVGNGIIFAMCFFMIPEVPELFFAGLAVADFLMISLCHFLWWILIGKDDNNVKEQREVQDTGVETAPKEKKPKLTKEEKKAAKKAGTKAEKKKKDSKKNWLSRDDEEESEYDSIFTSLLENEKKAQQSYVDAPKAMPETRVEDEKRFETGDYLKDIRQNLRKDQKIPFEPSQSADFGSQFPDVKVAEKSFERPAPMEFPAREFAKKNSDELSFEKPGLNAQRTEPITILPEMPQREVEKASFDQISNDLFAPLPEITAEKINFSNPTEPARNGIGQNQTELEGEHDFSSIEQRLGYLFYEIEKSMKETHYLQNAVGQFYKEVENYTPIAGDEKIVAAGNLIREKLKMIIDKQFIVDEVLDDLIRLSKLINKRINDLDRIEEGLNKRKMAMDQKDQLFTEVKRGNSNEKGIEIRPKEVVIEDLDSEFIVAEGDYDRIRQYLAQNPEDK